MSNEISKPKDSLGNALIIPRQFAGRDREFAALVADLQPHHCSFPSGLPLDEKSGKPCRRQKGADGCCTKHSEARLPTVLKNMPKSAARERLIEAYKDSRLLDARPNVAIEEYLLSERLAMLQNGESGRFIEFLSNAVDRLHRSYEQLQEAIADGDGAKVATTLKAIGSGIKAARKGIAHRAKHHGTLAELGQANSASMRAKEAASRMAESQGRVITYETAAFTIREICEVFYQTIDSEVSNKDERARVKEAVMRKLYSISGSSGAQV